MTRIAVALCAFGLASLACGAAPAEEFTARGKELMANKEARSDAERLRRILEISWEYTVRESPEFATAIGYPGQNDRWTDMSFEAMARLYGIKAVPAYAEKSQAGGYYEPGSLKAGRLGYFFLNTYDLPSRPKWGIETLTLHEAVPGHHFQLAIAQEMEDLPEFRKHGHYNAFGEGWALYAEFLGYEMGFFKDPYQNFGHLADEMLRAVRLVVDTGLHSMDWTREQAIKYFQENSGTPPHDIEVEVDRYIVWPSQALGYKIGQLKIQELRAYAEKELGQKMDLRAFHDEVLKNGALPMSVLETHIKEWVAKRKAA